MILPLFILLTLIFFTLALFLSIELLKKFRFMRDFAGQSHQLVVWSYDGNRKPGMYNLVLRGTMPFVALIGFKLNIPILKYTGFDHYGVMRSDDKYIAVFSTYLGKKKIEFQFLVNTHTNSSSISVTSSDEDQSLQPNTRCAPHWYQRLGFFS